MFHFIQIYYSVFNAKNAKKNSVNVALFAFTTSDLIVSYVSKSQAKPLPHSGKKPGQKKRPAEPDVF